jgi:hypothetical protein
LADSLRRDDCDLIGRQSKAKLLTHRQIGTSLILDLDRAEFDRRHPHDAIRGFTGAT